MNQRSTSPKLARGFTIPEVLVAAVVLGAALVVSVQISGALGRARHEAQHRQAALAEADNWLEELTATSWEELTEVRAEECRLSEAGAAQLPGGALNVEITHIEEQPPAKRVQVEVSWRDVRGEPLPPVRLAAWVYPRDAVEGKGE